MGASGHTAQRARPGEVKEEFGAAQQTLPDPDDVMEACTGGSTDRVKGLAEWCDLDHLSMFLIHPDRAVRGKHLKCKNCCRFSRPAPTARRPCCATQKMGNRRRQSANSVGTWPDGTPRVMEGVALQDALQNPIVWVR